MINCSSMGRLARTLCRLLPVACVVCGQNCRANYSICPDCEHALPRMRTSCQQCGCERADQSLIDSRCGKCLLSPPAFNFCQGVFRYDSPIDKLITNFKFKAEFDSGHALAEILSTQMQLHYANRPKPQLLIPVPLHSNRLRIRGFNQAVEIGRVVSRRCQITLAHSAVRKIRDTTPQIELNSAQSRKTNLRGAFAIDEKCMPVNTQFVALLDDVVTTMATVTAMSKLLRKHRVQRIDVWCLARAGR